LQHLQERDELALLLLLLLLLLMDWLELLVLGRPMQSLPPSSSMRVV
jgi:hypothetical protein